MKKQKSLKAFVISTNGRMATKEIFEQIRSNAKGEGISSERLDELCSDIKFQIKNSNKG